MCSSIFVSISITLFYSFFVFDFFLIIFFVERILITINNNSVLTLLVWEITLNGCVAIFVNSGTLRTILLIRSVYSIGLCLKIRNDDNKRRIVNIVYYTHCYLNIQRRFSICTDVYLSNSQLYSILSLLSICSITCVFRVRNNVLSTYDTLYESTYNTRRHIT